MKLLVSGCSITHGAELYNSFMSLENIKDSFPAHIAQRLGLELNNIALSGSSNEYIFHSLVNSICTDKDVKEVLAVWTSNDRLYWKNNARHYFLVPGWMSSMVNEYNFVPRERTVDGAWITGDTDEIVEELASVYKFFVVHYLGSRELESKLSNYRQCLRQLCVSKNINYKDIQIFDFTHIGNWFKEKRHPNKQEHIELANIIFERLYNQ